MKTASFKRFTSIVVSVALFFTYAFALGPIRSYAATLEQQKAAYNSKIQSAESEIAKLRAEKAPQQAIANKLQSQLADLTSQSYVIQRQRDEVDRKVTSLTAEINDLSKQITKTEKNLMDMNDSIDQTVDVFCQRLRANYMNGPTSYLDVLLNSKDLSSMLNQLELMKRVTDSDQKIVNKLNSDIDKAEKLKIKLKNDKSDAELKKTELGTKKIELDKSKAEYDKLILSAEAKAAEVNKILYGYNAKIEALHDSVEAYKGAEAKIDQAIKAAELQRQREAAAAAAAAAAATKKQSSGSSSGSSGSTSYVTPTYSSGTISTSGWMWPVPAGYISSYYGYRSDPATGASKFHGGLDIAAPCNSNILAARSGTVASVNYGNTGYGNYIMINHGDGSYTLYGHCLANFPVSSGQHVSQGQVIAHVGTSGYSTGYHCHFEVRDGSGNRLNPLNYVHK
ncbi:MAG: peptidoglycan DD-metalloendopeptidase family protein [Clostridia bacterium]|nr:peptidoglycan DD-metalloendopeptidase family protein [Clostridia bacterium]